MIRLVIPSIEADDLAAVLETLKSGYLVQGSKVAAFEETVANYVGTKYAVAVSSGTAALHLALLALNVGPGDLVIVTAYSWIATANVIELCGATPVFVDIDPDTFNISPAHLASTLQHLMSKKSVAKKLKAILPVHTFGQMADMAAILELGGRYKIPIVEDAACALGAKLNSQQAGSWGIMGCFSFHPRKAITTGEGGIITTNDADIAKYLRSLRNHGVDSEVPSQGFIRPGFNYRLTELQAALGITQMAKLERIIAKRRQLAFYYNRALQNTSIQVPFVSQNNFSVYQSYVALLPKYIAAHKQTIIGKLREMGIETTIGTLNMPLTEYYRVRYEYKCGDFPVTDETFDRSLTLPLYETLSTAEQDKVVTGLQESLEQVELA